MANAESAAPRPRSNAGQPATDIAWRLRNWIWYCQIKEAVRLSDDALDAKYLFPNPKSGARRRLFQRIRSVGSNPAQLRVDIGNKSLFDRVHTESTRALDAAAANFRSSLWNMLAEPGYAQREFTNVINGIVGSRGWYRAPSEDVELGLYFIKDDPAFGRHPDRENVFSSMLTALESHPCADNLALLGALFHEAMSAVDLETAAVLRDSLLACAALWMAKIDWRDTDDLLSEDIDGHWFSHGRVFERLLERRIVRNDWTKPQIDPSAYRNQRQYVQALLRANAQHDRIEGPSPLYRPLVLLSPRIRWLQKNRKMLGKLKKKLARADDQAQFCDSADPKLRKYGQECLEFGKKLRAQIRPPKRDTRHCLPVFPNRGPRHAHRAAPYLIDGTLDESGLLKTPVPTTGDEADRHEEHPMRDNDGDLYKC
jgi:hypothetical protein